MPARLALFSLLMPFAAQSQPNFVDFYGDTTTTVVWRANEGQVIDTEGDPRPDVLFCSEGGMVRRYVRDNGSTAFVINNADTTGHDTLLRVDMIASGEMALLPEVFAQYQTGGLNNYYLPHTAPGITGVHGHKRVVQENIYEKIDLIHYSGGSGDKMALVIWPGGNPEDVLLQFNGQDSLGIDPLLEDLIIYVRGKQIRIPEAVAYQIDNNENVVQLAWDADWVEAGNDQYATVSFDSFDPDLPVVLLFGRPPGAGGGTQNGNLDWSTQMGFETFSQVVYGSDTDPVGNVFIAGHTDDPNFPAIPGPVLNPGGTEIFYGKYSFAPGDPSSDAKNLWTTYYNGSDHDRARSLVYNSALGSIAVVGWTQSTDVDIKPPTDPMDGTFWQGTNKGGFDGLLITADTSNGTILRSTYYGGEGDDMIVAVAEGLNGDLYFTGTTETEFGGSGLNCTSPGTGFPTCEQPGAFFQADNAGGRDVFITRMDDAYQLLWSTFFGTPVNQVAFDISFVEDLIGLPYLAVSGRGPVPHFGPAGAFIDSTGQGFFSIFRSNGDPHWSTQLKVVAVQAIDLNGSHCVVTGSCVGDGALTCLAHQDSLSICDPGGGAYVQSTGDGTWDQYYADFDLPSATLQWSTIHGLDNYEVPDATDLWWTVGWEEPFNSYRWMDIASDPEGNFFCTGLTRKVDEDPHDFPTQAFPGFYYQPYESSQTQHGQDVTLVAFRPDRSRLLSTVFGCWQYQTDSLWAKFIAGPVFDYAMSLTYSYKKALYMTGVTGGKQDSPLSPGFSFPFECPMWGSSYCDSVGFPWNGFVSRFNMEELWIGMEESPAVAGNPLWCYPDPATDQITFMNGGQPLAGHHVHILDALGRSAMRAILGNNGQMSTISLSRGVYVAHVRDRGGRRIGHARFIKE